MKVSAKAEWVRVDRSALEVGDLFQADSRDQRVLAIVCQQDHDLEFLRLAIHGNAEGEIIIEPISSAGPLPLKYLGEVSIDPIRERGSLEKATFPFVRSEARHGNIIVHPERGAFLIVEETWTDGEKKKTAVDLQSGKIIADFKPSELLKGADVFSSWTLSGIGPDGIEAVFCSRAET